MKQSKKPLLINGFFDSLYTNNTDIMIAKFQEGASSYRRSK